MPDLKIKPKPERLSQHNKKARQVAGFFLEYT